MAKPDDDELARILHDHETRMQAIERGGQLRRSTIPDGDGVERPLLDAVQDGIRAGQQVGGAIARSLDEYVVTTSPTLVPPSDAGWSPDTPDWTPGEEFLWRRQRNTHIDGSVSYSAPANITGPDGQAGEDAVLLRISSSKGTAFKNSAIATVLTVTVFRGALQIVNLASLWDAFGTGAYLEWYWRRIDDDEFGVISSADSRLSQGGFALTISPADVDEKTDFQCILHTS